MESLEALKTRRSIRKYQNKKISDELISEIIHCAMYSPSAFDYQPWHFVVADKKEIFEDILKAASHAEMIKQASHAIIICGDRNLEENIGLLIQDISAATENLLLAAHSCGLGAVWVGIYPFEEIVNGIKVLFKLPENIVPISMAVVGYPAESPAPPERYKKERVHFNKW
ncbi:MAG TPA: nitroreductase family protein [Ignavibacteriaceae bacterium]|jgi:nitroreductase|nr:nitroreductase family protein [Ignavibacteriaceae bacterium]